MVEGIGFRASGFWGLPTQTPHLLTFFKDLERRIIIWKPEQVGCLASGRATV